MNYSEMSDFEINKAVAHKALSNKEVYEWHPSIQQGNGVTMCDDGVWFDFSPCNEINDAWPIIVENKISLEFHLVRSSGCAARSGITIAYDRNILRAAMIVYLLMGEKA